MHFSQYYLLYYPAEEGEGLLPHTPGPLYDPLLEKAYGSAGGSSIQDWHGAW